MSRKASQEVLRIEAEAAEAMTAHCVLANGSSRNQSLCFLLHGLIDLAITQTIALICCKISPIA